MKRICLLALLFSAMFLNGPAVAENFFNDNFDSYTTGSVPGDAWIVNQSGGDVLVSDTGFSGKSVRIQRTDFTGGGINVNFGHMHNEVFGMVTYEGYFNSSTVDRETLAIYAYSSSDNNTGPWVSVGAIPGQLASYDGSWNSITPISANTWYHFKIVVYISSNTFDVYVDDMNTPKKTGLHFRDSGVIRVDSLWFQVFNAFNPPINGDLAYVDNISAFVPTTVGAPTLTEWGMIILTIILGIGSIYYLRSRATA